MQQLPLIISLCTCTLATWGWLIYRRFTGQRVLPLRPPRELAAWGPAHLLLAILSVLVFQVVAHSVIAYFRGPFPLSGTLVDEALLHMALSSAGVLAAFFSLWVITRTTSSTARDLGIRIRPLLPGVTIGLLCFFSFAVPSYALNELLSLLDPRIHPVVKSLLESGDMQSYSCFFVTVVFLSPLYEEIICRLVLQGWLQAVFARRHPASGAVTQVDGDSPVPAPVRPTCWRSILLSSLFFSVLHFNAGLGSVVSLFLFAIGLGLIYQRSGRLLPCLVMHMALNATTMLALYLQIRS